MKKHLDKVMTHLKANKFYPMLGSRWRGSQKSYWRRTFSHKGATYLVEVIPCSYLWSISYLRLELTERLEDNRLDYL